MQSDFIYESMVLVQIQFLSMRLMPMLAVAIAFRLRRSNSGALVSSNAPISLRLHVLLGVSPRSGMVAR